jgi:hypothetical protein
MSGPTGTRIWLVLLAGLAALLAANACGWL